MFLSSPKAQPARPGVSALLLVLVAALCLALPASAPAATKSAFQSQGMWIWYVSQAEGGSINKIVARARKYKVKTLYIKSSDGANWWKQWDTYAAKFKERGLNVCAWQYVYGSYPVVEAELAARAANSGADCIVVDAEVEYKGRYKQAATYVKTLRQKIGTQYPVGFTSFAYPDYHPTVPYSVFLGSGGAQWNLPQMYFRAFRQSVYEVFRHTFFYNRIYQRPIHPLGQTYEGVSFSQAKMFRRYVRAYNAKGYSWWVWHDTRPKTWQALKTGLGAKLKRPKQVYPVLYQGNSSDIVRWTKLKLNAWGEKLTVSNSFDAKMTAAVKRYQTASDLPVTGRIDATTWPVLQKIQLPALDLSE